jgi:hypothetical protein
MTPDDRSPGAGWAGASGEIVRAAKLNVTRDTSLSSENQGRLVDRFGHEHSEAIFRNWTPAAIKALGIQRVRPAYPSTSTSKQEL